MKFTPESLLEIYLNGSFTEEAQAEFDRLVRKDPVFAERVTQAVAERVGPPPASLEQVGANLDAKIDGIWKSHRPSPWKSLVLKAAGVVLVAAAATGLYGTYHHYWAQHNPLSGEEDLSTAGGGSDNAGGETPNNVNSKSGQGERSSSGDLKGSSRPSGDNTAFTSEKLPVTVNPGSLTPPPYGVTGSASGLKGTKSVDQAATSGKPGSKSPAGVSGATQEGDLVRVSIDMQKAGNVVVTVLDSNGLLVRHLYAGPWTVGEHLVDWDGKDEIGNTVLPGNYTVVVKAGKKTMTGTVTIQGR